MERVSLEVRQNCATVAPVDSSTQSANSEVFFQLANRVATALDSVRRNGHQQFGRLEKSLALGTLARFLR